MVRRLGERSLLDDAARLRTLIGGGGSSGGCPEGSDCDFGDLSCDTLTVRGDSDLQGDAHVGGALTVDGAASVGSLAASGLVKGDDVEAVDEVRGARATLAGDVNAGGQVHGGSLSSDAAVQYSGDLRPVRGGTVYTGYPVIPEPSGGATHDDWNGDAKTVGDYTIDTTAWGLPAGVRGVWIRMTARWAAAGGAYWAGARRDASAQYTAVCTSQVANVPYTDSGFVPCDSSGKFSIHVAADTTYTYVVIAAYVI